MLNSQNPYEQSSYVHTYRGLDTPVSLSPAGLLKIEDYLDRICAPLVGYLDYSRRSDLRSEVRQHLLSLAAAHMELGFSPDEAVEAALDQFGPPEVIAKQWRAESEPRFRRLAKKLSLWRPGVGVVTSLCLLMALAGYSLRGPSAVTRTVTTNGSAKPAASAGISSPNSQFARGGVGFSHSFAVRNMECTQCHRDSMIEKFRIEAPPQSNTQEAAGKKKG